MASISAKEQAAYLEKKNLQELKKKEKDEAAASLIEEFPEYKGVIDRIHSPYAPDLSKRYGSTATKYDPRFPNQNQTAHCWQNYVDYHKCINAKGKDFAPCAQFKLGFEMLCPQTWVDKWDEQRENGNFVGDLSP